MEKYYFHRDLKLFQLHHLSQGIPDLHEIEPTTSRMDFADPCILRALEGPSGSHPRLLDREDAIEIINASEFAKAQERPHLVHVTIRWDMSETFMLRDWMEHQGRLLDKAARWLRRNNLPVAYIWIREMGRNNGPHTHLLLHLPHQHWQQFKSFLMIAGGFTGRDASGEAIVLSGGKYGTKSAAMQAGHLRYLCKSLDPAAIMRTADGNRTVMDALGIHNGGERRLPIVGKRCGASYSIGAMMRRNFNWRELRTVAELRAVLHP